MALKTLAELKTGRDFNDVLESYSNISDRVGTQGAQATTADSTAVITAANIATGIVQCTPTADREKDTDTAFGLAYAHAEDDFLNTAENMYLYRAQMGLKEGAVELFRIT